MQTTRLFRLLYLLLENPDLTAARLAELLEVSPRTVYRDIEALSAAGIPIYCERGRGGGVRMLPGFTLSRAMLTEEERRDVLAALQGLTAAGETGARDVLSKLGSLFRPVGQSPLQSWVAVDFADWGQASAAQFEALKTAVLERRVITFRYHGTAGGATAREAEPLQLWFKHRAWYLRAWCRTRGAPRLFKLSRMEAVALTDRRFERELDLSAFVGKEEASPAPVVELTLDIAPWAAYRVYDEFAHRDIEVLPQGGFRVKARFLYEEWVLGYILSFGPAARVVEPQWLREELAARLKAMTENYF